MMFCFFLRREEGGAPGLWEHTKTCSNTDAIGRASACDSMCVREWVCVCARAHTACVRHAPVLIPVGIRCSRVLRPWSWMSYHGFVPGAFWVFPRSGCLLTKTYLESIKDLKMSDHQNVITLLPSFNWWLWGWRLRLHTSHRYHSPNLPGSRPLLMLTGLGGLSKAWLGFLLHHV